MTDAGLQGRLADFTLEEILQLIALQQKSGLLMVDASYPMVLAFESGILVGYRDVRRMGTDPLENFLKSYGFFGPESWEHIDFVQRHSKLDLTEILVNEGLLEVDELAALQMEAAQEDVFRGMQLRDGRYHFTPGREGMAGLKGRVRIKVDGLLMEAVRRIDEINGLRERYFSTDLRVRRVDFDTDVSGRGEAERRLLAAVGTENRLAKVIATSKMSEFDTLSLLDGLREDGLVAIMSLPREKDEIAAEDSDGGRRARELMRPIMVSILNVILWGALAVWQPWSGYASATDPASPAARAEFARQRGRVEAAVQLFAQNHDRLPSNFRELGADQWLDSSTVRWAEEHLEYARKGESTWFVNERWSDETTANAR